MCLLIYTYSLGPSIYISFHTRIYSLSLTHTRLSLSTYTHSFGPYTYITFHTRKHSLTHTRLSLVIRACSPSIIEGYTLSHISSFRYIHTLPSYSLTHTFAQLYTRDLYLHTRIPSRPFLSHTHLSLAICACSLSVNTHAPSPFLSFNMHTLVIFSHTHLSPVIYTQSLRLHACILCRPFLSYTHHSLAIYVCSLLGKYTYCLTLLFVQYAHSPHPPSHTH